MYNMKSYKIFLICFSFILVCSCNNTSLNKDITTKKNSSIKDSIVFKNPFSKLITDLDSVSIDKDYIMVGKLNVDTLIFKDVAFGDIEHFYFLNKNNKEIDFSINSTKVKLSIDAPENEDNGGVNKNKLFANKRFIVIWRNLKLKSTPKDEFQFYYEQYNEILFLKLIDN